MDPQARGPAFDVMIARVLAAMLLLLPAAGLGAAVRTDVAQAKPRSMPEIRVDGTPIDRTNVPMVTSYADALEEIRHSVVSIASTKVYRQRSPGFPFDDPLLRRFFGPGFDQRERRIQQGLGSGVVVSADGYVLTNNHVIEGADEIKVALQDGREFDAVVIGSDARTDVAVLKIDASDLPHATLADSDSIRVGDLVFAVGNPLGVGQTTTMGIVSATGRSNLRIIDQGYENFIQTDASINPGNSGGALVDATGRVVGINTAIISTSRGSIGIGFAIPINLAANVMRSLIETGTVARGFLGVQLQDVDAELAAPLGLSEARGAIVMDVVPGSPAAMAGVRQGDVLIGFAEHPVANSAELRLMIAQMAPGSETIVRVSRNGEPVDLKVVLGALEGDDVDPRNNEIFPGVTVAPVAPELRDQFEIADGIDGLVVVDAAPDSRYGAVLVPGTVIVKINGKPADDIATARELLVRGKNLLLLNNRGAFRYIAVAVE